MSRDPQDSIILPAPDLHALARIYGGAAIQSEALILQLEAIARSHTDLLTVDRLPDYDLHPSAQAKLRPSGRSLVNAFMAGQLSAYRQIREFGQTRCHECSAHFGSKEAAPQT